MDRVEARTGELVTSTGGSLPTLIAAGGEQTAWRYVEFFTVNIRNPNTRAAYSTTPGLLEAGVVTNNCLLDNLHTSGPTCALRAT
jgi:hypothetical protein